MMAPLASAEDAPKEKGPRLVYSRGPVECPSEEGFRGEVATHTDGVSDYFDAEGAAEVSVAFEKAGNVFRGTVVCTNAAGEKDLPKVVTRPDCEALTRHVGSAAASCIPKRLWMRSAAALTAQTAAPTAQAAAPSAQAVASAPTATAPDPCGGPCATAKAPPPAAPAASLLLPAPKPQVVAPILIRTWYDMDLTIGLSTFAIATAGFTANAGPGIQIGVEFLRGDVISIGLDVRGIFPSKVYAREVLDPSLGYSRPVEFDLSQFTGALVPCVHWWKYFYGCPVFQVGVIIGHQDPGLVDDPTVMAGNVNLGPRLGMEVPITEQWAAMVFGEALFNLAYPKVGWRFDIPYPNDPTPVANVRWEQSVVSGFFGLGMRVRFK
jgi:hypothetical protein